MAVELGDFVRVVNKDSISIRLTWAGRRYEADPGQEVMAPFEAVMKDLGDPRATEAVRSVSSDNGTVQFISDRLTEKRRLELLYHVVPPPKVEVFTMSGDRIWTVAEDPDGEHVTPTVITVSQSSSDKQRIQRLESQVNYLLDELRKTTAGGFHDPELAHEANEAAIEAIHKIEREHGLDESPLEAPLDETGDLIPTDNPKINFRTLSQPVADYEDE